MSRLSHAQRNALTKLATGGIGCEWDGDEWCYIPWASEQRTYDVLFDRGLIVYRSVPAVTYNGYRITDAGRAALL